jgi:ribonuclease HI
MLNGKADVKRPVGPIPSNGRWALVDIYDMGEHLKAVSKKVVVAWIKGHKGGEGTTGNRRADAAAGGAVKATRHFYEFELPASDELPE